jgi:hypothetical protein
LLSSISSLFAQQVSFISVSDDPGIDKVKFSLNATYGQCLIERGQKSELLNVQSKIENAAEPRLEEKVVQRTKQVKIATTEDQYSTLGTTLSKRLFSSNPEDDYTWKVYLSKLKPLDLDLNYSVGDTYIDLSDLPVERLKMRSGNANIKVNYKTGMGNLMKMDTFFIKVDMGTFEAQNLYLCNSSNIITDIGFGKVKMDFKDAEEINTKVYASVGAGKLEVILPQENVPVRININESPLCNIKMPASFQKVAENVFETPGFDHRNSNNMNFDVDVAVGNIIFK